MTPMSNLLYHAMRMSWGTLSETQQRVFLLRANNNRLLNALKYATEDTLNG